MKGGLNRAISAHVSRSAPQGSIKGIKNLGNTCFLNVVLQVRVTFTF